MDNEEVFKAFKGITKYIENEIQRLEEASEVKGEETYNNFQLNIEYIKNLLIEKYIREVVVPKINKLSIAGIKKQIDKTTADEQTYYENLVYNIQDYIEPIETTMILSSNEYNNANEPLEEMNEKLKLILEENGITFAGNVDIKKEVVNTINRKMFEFDKSSRTNPEYLHVYQIFIKTLQIIITNYSINNYVGIPFTANNIQLRELGEDLGILTKEIIVNQHSIEPRDVHGLLDIEEFLDDFEEDNLEPKQKRFILKSDYMKRYIHHYKCGNLEKARKYLNEFSVRDIVVAYKGCEINCDELIQIITTPHFSKNKRQKVKEELRKVYISDSKKEQEDLNTQIFSPTNFLELAKLGFVSEFDFMVIIKQQEDFKKQHSSTMLFEDEYEFIPYEEIHNYFNSQRFIKQYFRSKPSDFNVVIAFYKNYILDPEENSDEFEKFGNELINNENVKAKDIVKFYSIGLLYHDKMKELSDKNPEIQEEFYKFLRSQPINKVFFIVNNGGIDEDDLIGIYDDDYENILREAIRNGLLFFGYFKNFSYLENSGIILEEHENAIAEHQEDFKEADEDIKRTNYNDIMATYLSSDNLISIEDISKILKEHKDPIFFREGFELGTSICNIIRWIHKEMPQVDMLPKIRELYMHSYLSEELGILADEGIIKHEDAQKIANDFVNSQKFEELKRVKLGDSDSQIPTSSSTPKPCVFKRVQRQLQDPTDKQVLQGETIIKYLRSLGFQAKTATNAYGIEQMDTFGSGDFKDYRVFMSDENPGVIVLAHLKQVTNTDTYYHVGGNATYLMTTSQFFQYLKATGKIDGDLVSFNTSKSTAKNSKYTITANVGPTWTSTVPRKIGQILSMFDRPDLREMKDKNFEISTLLPDRLSQEERENRLRIIAECIEEFNEVKELE